MREFDSISWQRHVLTAKKRSEKKEKKACVCVCFVLAIRRHLIAMFSINWSVTMVGCDVKYPACLSNGINIFAGP